MGGTADDCTYIFNETTVRNEENKETNNNKHKIKLSNEDILKMFHASNRGTYNMSNVMNGSSDMSSESNLSNMQTVMGGASNISGPINPISNIDTMIQSSTRNLPSSSPSTPHVTTSIDEMTKN